jgi:hypothetical protein
MNRSNKYLSLAVIFSTAIVLTGCLANQANRNLPNTSNTYNNPPVSQPANNYGKAGLPRFNFSCPTGIDVHGDDQGGAIYINGKPANVKKFNDNYYEASNSGISIAINRNPDGSLVASYTRQGGVNGICQDQSTNSGNNNAPSGAPTQAQQPVLGQVPPALATMVGAKGGQAEGFLMNNGYVAGRSQGLTTFWQEQATGGCVGIRTADGRYQSIVYVAPNSCK